MRALSRFYLAFMAVAWACQVQSREPPEGKQLKEPYVEFDFTKVPEGPGKVTLSIKVHTTDPDISYESKYSWSMAPGGPPWPKGQVNAVRCENLLHEMKGLKFKAEVVDKTKIRVYGRTFNDKLLPAIKGVVESPDLKKEELPKVKNPGKDL
jgi:hypothetical protein